jgi:hypothetical protein
MKVSAESGQVFDDLPVCGMKRSTKATCERAMKIQEVMLPMAKRIA